MTTPFVALDLVVNEGFCNLTCDYCLTGQSSYRREDAGPRANGKHNRPGRPLTLLMEDITRQAVRMDIPVIKISGGEYLLLENAVDALRKAAEKYETVVVMTNGLPLTSAMLKALGEIPNLVLQISLDGTTFEANRLRISSSRLHVLFLERLRLLCQSAIPFEVYLIINRNSIQTISQTLYDIKAFGGAVPVFPFPVRGPRRKEYLPAPSQMDALRNLMNDGRFAALLPHKRYMEMLLEFCIGGRRVEMCHIPRAAFTVFDDGAISTCPNIWFDKVANMLEDGAEVSARKLEESSLRRGLLRFQAFADLCRFCFTPWDIVNLYMDGFIPLTELARSHMFKGPRALGKLEEIRASVNGGCHV